MIISGVMEGVEEILDDSIEAESYVIRERGEEYGEHLVDLSQIDFEALKAKFDRGRKHTEAEKVKGAVARTLAKLLRFNRTRMDYMQRFQRMIDEYNAGSVNVDEFFWRLLAFAQDLNAEDQRRIGASAIDRDEVFALDGTSEMSAPMRRRSPSAQVETIVTRGLYGGHGSQLVETGSMGVRTPSAPRCRRSCCGASAGSRSRPGA